MNKLNLVLAIILFFITSSLAVAGDDGKLKINEGKNNGNVEVKDYESPVKAEKDTFKNNPQPLKTKLLTLMEPHTDFESFAKGVMGGYYDEATPEQREKFMHDFKSTLIDLYTKALVAFEVKEMKVQILFIKVS